MLKQRCKKLPRTYAGGSRFSDKIMLKQKNMIPKELATLDA